MLLIGVIMRKVSSSSHKSQKMESSSHRSQKTECTDESGDRHSLLEDKLVEVGDIAPDFELVDCEGETHTLSCFRGRRVLLSFFRYALCPTCLYNVNRLRQLMDFLNEAGIVTICVFPSMPESIAKYPRKKMSEGSLALSDRGGAVSKSFQVNKLTTKTMITGANELLIRNKRRYMEHWDPIGNREERSSNPEFKRVWKQLPADFLIDEDGRVVDLFRAKNVRDHITIDRIEAFLPEDKRCKCNRKDCMFPGCRRRYQEIRKKAEAMYYREELERMTSFLEVQAREKSSGTSYSSSSSAYPEL